METLLLQKTLQLVLYLALPILGAIVLASILAGILKVSTQVEDISISFTAKLAVVIALIYFLSVTGLNKVLEFAERIWNSRDYFY